MSREFGHKRCFGHSGLGVHLKADQFSAPRWLFVEPEIRSCHTLATERAMRLETKFLYFLVNKW